MTNNRNKLVENIQFLVLALLIVGQCVVGNNFYIGQFVYLAANILSTGRAFYLRRPAADKVKEVCCLAVTVGIITIRLLT